MKAFSDPLAEIRGKGKSAPERKLFPLRCSACLRDLSNLRHDTAHRLCCLVLLLSCCVGVGAEREARGRLLHRDTARCLELRLEDQVIDRVLDILPGIGVRVFQCALRDVLDEPEIIGCLIDL